MTLIDFNSLDKQEAAVLLQTCCGSALWVSEVLTQFPFESEKELIKIADNAWYNKCKQAVWLEAFTHHPKIGDTKSLTEKYASTQHFADSEQVAVKTASEDTITQLAQLNELYEAKFGFIFIVCATNKSADEMLRLITDRITNSHDEELLIAMGEQHKITIIRLQQLIESPYWTRLAVSQLTTHVLDTSVGKPGRGITVRLKSLVDENWLTISQGVTNADGRVGDLLPPEKNLSPGNYKIIFETEKYFSDNNVTGFYPEVEIQFTVTDNAHYHVPLLINPFGYSTYRGS
jgi:5-hydroxyisourate hydrolase/2-oxo-4-hydroxy-4-carboxy-5-ureidoimidazoline decarboxylase